jgi:hypothetical protein
LKIFSIYCVPVGFDTLLRRRRGNKSSSFGNKLIERR